MPLAFQTKYVLPLGRVILPLTLGFLILNMKALYCFRPIVVGSCVLHFASVLTITASKLVTLGLLPLTLIEAVVAYYGYAVLCVR